MGGTFKGNRDMNTEVSHCLDPKGVECRYLRFRPLGCNKAPAFRVGVYGTALDKEKTKDKADELVEYTLSHIREHTRMNRVPRRCGSCRYGCARCSKTRGMCKVPDESTKQRRTRTKADCQQQRFAAIDEDQASLEARFLHQDPIFLDSSLHNEDDFQRPDTSGVSGASETSDSTSPS